MEHRRIYRAKDKEAVIQGLMAAGNPTFKEIWRVLLFAASVGYSYSKPEPLSSFDSSRGIDFQTFGNSAAWPGFLYLLSLVEKDDSIALSGDPEVSDFRIGLFERYANGGLSIIRDKCESHTYSLDSIIALIVDTNGPLEAAGDLSDVAI